MHDRSRRARLRARAGAVVFALAASGLVAGCKRDAAPAAAPFGGPLAQALPHRDVLGFLTLDPNDAAWLARRELKFGSTDLLKQASVLLPAVTLLKLAAEPGVVASGGSIALLFLDSDVHGGLAACAWRGDADALRTAARANGIPIDESGRLLLPGRGRARDFELLTDSLRQLAPHDEPLLTGDVVMPAAGHRQRETPRVPHWIVERDGVVLVLPAPDGERNLFDTLDATRLLDVEAARRPCLRLAIGRLNERFRGLLLGLLWARIETLLPVDRSIYDASLWRARSRAWRVATGVLDAFCSVDEIFVQREREVWRGYLRTRPDSFGARLLDVVVDRPVAELLADLPNGTEWIAGRVDPDALQALPEQWERTRQEAVIRMGRPPSREFFLARSSEEEVRREQERATDFLSSITGRFWCAGTLDASAVGGVRGGIGGGASFDADSIGATRFATFFERKPDAEPVGLFTTLLETLVPKTWRDPIRVGSLLVYRSAPLERGSLEVLATAPDRALREMLAAIARGGVAPPAAAPAEAFLALRAPLGAPSGLAGLLFATRAGLGIELRFVPASP